MIVCAAELGFFVPVTAAAKISLLLFKTSGGTGGWLPRRRAGGLGCQPVRLGGGVTGRAAGIGAGTGGVEEAASEGVTGRMHQFYARACLTY